MVSPRARVSRSPRAACWTTCWTAWSGSPAPRPSCSTGRRILAEDYLAVRPDRRPALARRRRRWPAAGRALVRAGGRADPLGRVADTESPGRPRRCRAAWPAAGRALFARRVRPPRHASRSRARVRNHRRRSSGAACRDLARDLVRWRGPAGGELAALPSATRRLRDRRRAPRRGRGARAAHGRRCATSLVSRAATRHVAVFVGADHHRGPRRARGSAAAPGELEPEHEVRISRLDDFLRAASAEAGEIPDRGGELRWSDGYTWTLQGVHGTRTPLKRRNSRARGAPGAHRRSRWSPSPAGPTTCGAARSRVAHAAGEPVP